MFLEICDVYCLLLRHVPWHHSSTLKIKIRMMDASLMTVSLTQTGKNLCQIQRFLTLNWTSDVKVFSSSPCQSKPKLNVCLVCWSSKMARPSYGIRLSVHSGCFKQLRTCYLWHRLWIMVHLCLRMWTNITEVLEILCMLIGVKLLTREALVRVIGQRCWECHGDTLDIT